MRVALPVGPVEIGGGAWGAAQPGAARLDAGPQSSYRLPVRRANLRLAADWRFRVAGDAAPGSGPRSPSPPISSRPRLPHAPDRR